VVVFAGAALALVATSAVAAIAGEAVLIPLIWIRRGTGVLFPVLGAIFLLGHGD
jgi:putative Ca2+/H+ antiporter (TMEM165/GDT1 family)